MKRPLTFVCALLSVCSMIKLAAEDKIYSPLLEKEQILYEEAGEKGSVTISGTVKKCSAVSAGVRLFLDHISVISDDNSKADFIPEQKITFTTEHTEYLPGDQMIVRGTFMPFLPPSNPGQFDQRGWYFRQNTICSLDDPEILQIYAGKPGIRRLLYEIQRAMQQSYEEILSEKAAGIITAVSLGEKGFMKSQWKTAYQEGGIAHVIAVSGLHVSLVGMSLYGILRRLGVPFFLCAGSSGTAVWLYVLLTGSGLSSIRALLMFFIWLGAQICGRKYDMLTSAALVAAIMILPDPGILQESSLWLSFSAILSLAVIVLCIQKACNIQSSLGKSLAGGIAVWVGMLPVTQYFFYQIIPWSILVNLAVIPLMSAVMSFGLFGGLAGMIDKSLGVFLAAPVEYLLGFFELLCELEQKLPGAVWVTGRPDWWKIIVYYAGLGAVLKVTGASLQKKKSAAMIWLGFLVWGFVFMGASGSKGMLRITCLDVGQGDGTLLRMPDGRTCLIDGGSSSESKIWTYRMGQAVKYYGIRTIDYVFLSHADADHTSGILEFLTEYEDGFAGQNVHGITVKHLVLPPVVDREDFKDLQKLALENKITLLRMDAGDVVSGNQWKMTCLAPDKETLTGNKNEDSMVLRLKYGDFSMLFTGDMEGSAEEILLESAEAKELQADVLKVGHHGSKNGSSRGFLEKVDPEMAVISCGMDNSYGHPSPETIKRLKEAGARIFTTMEDGAVEIVTDGRGYRVYTFSNSEENP